MSNLLWTVISGFARFPELRSTINDSWYVLAHVLLKLSLIVPQNSRNRAIPENDSPLEITHKIVLNQI